MKINEINELLSNYKLACRRDRHSIVLHKKIWAMELDQTGRHSLDNFQFLMCFFLCLFCMFHRRYSNCRPLNSARYNRIICQTVENTSFFERLSCIIERVGERLPRLQIQFRISRSFRPQNLVNPRSKIRFWIRRKEHTLSGDFFRRCVTTWKSWPIVLKFQSIFILATDLPTLTIF